MRTGSFTFAGVAWGKMTEQRVARQCIKDDPSLSDYLHLPAADNEPGALEALLSANKVLRARRWPEPYDRTRHEIVLGDARDLRSIKNESVHLVLTSPPYFNLKPYASDAGGAQLGRIDDYETFLGELDRAWRECARVL